MSVSEFVTPVRLQAGVLKITDRAHFEAGLRQMRDGGYLLHLERPSATRSNSLNSLYWVGYVAPFVARTGSTPMEIHSYFKRKFLPKCHLVVHNGDGVIIDEVDLDGITTRTLPTEDFKNYLLDIEALSLEAHVKVGSNRDGE